MSKIYLFVDGSNLYGTQYSILGPKKYLSFPSLISEIEAKLKIKYHQIFVYGSFSSKNEGKAQPYLASEQKFFQSTYQLKNSKLIQGHRSPTSGKEKGVDVALACDMVRGRYEKWFTEAHILTGDADFQYAIQIVKELLPVKVICYENKVAYPLAYHSPTYVFYDKRPPRKIPTHPHITWIKTNPTYRDAGYISKNIAQKIRVVNKKGHPSRMTSTSVKDKISSVARRVK